MLKETGIDAVFRINPAGRIYGVTFIDHEAGIVANGSLLGKEFSANAFNELYPAREEEAHAEEQERTLRHAPAINPISGAVDALLELADAHAYEEQQQTLRRRKKRQRRHKI